MSKKPALLLALLVTGLGLTAKAAPRGRVHPPRATELSGVVNLNTATEAELELLPGVGKDRAERILEVRGQHRFASADQVMQVRGIGRKSFQKLKPFLAVSGPTTLAAKHAPAPKAPAGAN